MEDSRGTTFRNPARRLTGAARVSIVPNQSQSSQTTSRLSLSTMTSRRRTTIFDPSTTGIERNLNKEALGSNIKHIIQFMSLHNYNQEISTFILRNLNERDFESIVKFLFRMIDPNIKYGNDFKEDFPKIMHMLGYPSQFKKSTMNSINSPFNLPTVIAAIKWLTQVVDFIQSTQDLALNKEKTSEVLLYESMKQAYQFFMENDDDSMELVIKGVGDECDKENQKLESDLARYELRQQELDNEVKMLSNLGQEIHELKAKEKVLLGDIEKFNVMVQAANSAIKDSNERLKTTEARQESMEKKLKELRAKNDGLREKINQQEFSPDQIEGFRKDYATWKGRMNDITSQRQIVTVTIDELVSTIDTHISSIDSMIGQYHELLLALQLLPSTTQLANGVDYRLVLDRVAEVSTVSIRNVQHYQTQITSNTMLTRLQSLLEEYSKSVEKAINSFREEIVKFDDKRQKKESDLEQKNLSVNNLKERCEQIQNQRDDLLKQCSVVQQQSTSDSDQMKMHITETKVRIEKAKNRITNLKKQMEVETEKSDDYEAKLIQEEKEIQEVILSLLDAISKYKETIDNEIQRFHAFSRQYHSE